MIKYITLEQVKLLHAAALKKTGSNPQSLRKDGENLLASTLNRPLSAAYYEGADLMYQAALLCVGISQAQAFTDGNKRTALAVIDTFLRINGYKLPPQVAEIIDWLEKAANPSNDRSQIERELSFWLAQNVNEQ